MSGFPVLDVFERNRGGIAGTLCMLGAPGQVPAGAGGDSIHTLTTHFGQWEQQGGHGRCWYFGYDDPELPAVFDHVIIFMPKARSELAMRCAWAVSRIRPGGEIWLVGAKKEGIAGGARRFSERFPDAYKADSARHCQLWKARIGEDIAATPFRITDWLSEAPVHIGSESLSLFSLPGLFSEGRLDPGTKLLLGTIAERPQGPVLDVACGNGVIGAWLAHSWPDLELTLTDVQWQAVTCARWAMGDHERARVVASDGLSRAGSDYGTIITNPPFHQGVATDSRVTETLIGQAPAHLAPHGEIRLVANAFLPYSRSLERAFGKVKVLADDGDYRVYQAFREKHSRKK